MIFMKGISPIVSLIALLLIAIVMIGMSYAFIFDAMLSRTAAPFSIVDSFDNNLFIKNVGEEDITTFTVFTVDGEDALIWIEGTESIYYDDFNDRVANGWTVLSGDWSADSQSYMSDGRDETAESGLDLGFSGAMIKYDMRFGEVIYPDIILMIDKSWSMLGKMGDAKDAAQSFVDQLNSARDRSAVVSYSTDATLDQELTLDHDDSKSAIDDINLVFGGTAIDKAINVSNQELINNGRPDAKKVAILLSDGENNCGYPPPLPDECDDWLNGNVTDAADNGIIIYTIGLGMSPGSTAEQILMNISDVTGGKYYDSPTSAELESIYDEIAAEILVPGNTSLILKDNDNKAIAGLTFSIDPDFIEVFDPQTGQVIDSETTSFDFNVWYTVEISVSGRIIGVMVNDYLLGGATNKGDGGKSGISLVTENSMMFFDNFDVSRNAINPGTSARIKIMNDLPRGTYKVHVCTVSMCATNRIEIK
jgi:hypothetical protein